jgi:cell division protein FtsW (lipid II flippase)
VGNIVFSFLMMSVSIVLIVESIQEIATRATNPETSDTNTFHVPAVAAVSIAFIVKFCLFCYCWPLRHYPQVPHNHRFFGVVLILVDSNFVGGPSE